MTEATDTTDEATIENDEVVTAGERFPTNDIELEPGARVWVDSGALHSYCEIGDGGSQGCTVTAVDGDEITVEYPNHGETETATIAIEHVRETDLREDERVTIAYDSSYTPDDAPKTEKTGDVVAVQRSRRGAFGGIVVAVDGTEYTIGSTGGVRSRDSGRRLGSGAVVERDEDEVDRGRGVETDGGEVGDSHAVTYLRLDGVAPEDLSTQSDVDPGTVAEDLAMRLFAAIERDYPDLYEDLDGVIPVLNPEHDPLLSIALDQAEMTLERFGTIYGDDEDEVDRGRGVETDGGDDFEPHGIVQRVGYLHDERVVFDEHGEPEVVEDLGVWDSFDGYEVTYRCLCKETFGDDQEAAADHMDAVAAARERPTVTTEPLDDDVAPDATNVYVHRDPNPAGISDNVFCTFAQAVADVLEVSGVGDAKDWVEGHVHQHYDGDDGTLDELVPTVDDVEEDDDLVPPCVGRLHFDREAGRVVALYLDPEAFDGVEESEGVA